MNIIEALDKEQLRSGLLKVHGNAYSYLKAL